MCGFRDQLEAGLPHLLGIQGDRRGRQLDLDFAEVAQWPQHVADMREAFADDRDFMVARELAASVILRDAPLRDAEVGDRCGITRTETVRVCRRAVLARNLPFIGAAAEPLLGRPR
jgi:hypothetical protein